MWTRILKPAYIMSRHGRRIDVHNHCFSPESLEVWRRGAEAQGMALPHFSRDWTVARALGAMDDAGVETAIVSTPLLNTALHWLDTPALRKLARATNDFGAGMVRDHPGRFGYFAFLPMPDIDGSLSETAYALDVLKADGILLMTSYDAKWLGDPAFEPLFADLDRRGAIVYVHPLVPECCEGLLPGIPPSFIEYPHDTTRTVLSLLFAGTFVRFPSIRFIFSHGGGTIPMLADRVATLVRSLDRDVSAIAPNGIGSEFRKLYFDTANVAFAGPMAALRSCVPDSQILFGSDYPFLSIQENVDSLNEIGLGEPLLEAIERGNALRLLRIPARA
jgi:predicted TIM-barrel fold metal-dependent hydrolase